MSKISTATQRNWQRLNVNEKSRLTKRANKTRSDKQIIPLEYFLDKSNIAVFNKLLEIIKAQKYELHSLLYSVAINLLEKANVLNKNNVQIVLQAYLRQFNCQKIKEICEYKLPEEFDLLGLIYQSLLSEGQKNLMGSYYTPQYIVKGIVKDFNFSNNQTFLDPCCGSGAYLLALDASDPRQLFGIDKDENAVFIAKINLFLKYKNLDFSPQIFCLDYLSEQDLFNNNAILTQKFDYIATNPPWGANASCKNKYISSGETSSLFFSKAFLQLKKNAVISFLLPEAILNVKVHKDIRKFILEQGNLEEISLYSDSFTGVVTKYINVKLSNKSQREYFEYINATDKRTIAISNLYKTENLIFNFLENTTTEIIEHCRKLGKFNLSNSIWALGIVTGNNQEKLLPLQIPDTEVIYTGKEIQAYVLKPAKNYIKYERHNFQQVAKDEIYRADEKLVYKFISNKLVFAYDNSGSLFLNSANILIPKIQGMSVKTVMAFLNSELYQFLYSNIFGEIKVLKGNLMQLPFLAINVGDDLYLLQLVDEYMKTSDKHILEKINNFIYKLFFLSDTQIKYIQGNLYGKP